ncbi:MAG: YraN family protein [Agathobaculum sp.]|uniref:YraN family protein n=1 Tax=Agathobaculum sp. TaxID=2048138 RepID=UPI0025C31516|nr:YraN family protein [Agathobaculum sp.]MCI7126184.1 YraN family protein [Agathobaculum sp.]MDY3711959.1 YraN family protein [Agathobaculum sp.]
MTGAWGERQACGYLRARGWEIVQCNFRTRFGEIDIIARHGKYIIFAEVKTRRSSRFAAARESVTAAKQARIIAAAEEWLQTYAGTAQPRFDVIEVYGSEDAPLPPHINLIENAFGG